MSDQLDIGKLRARQSDAERDGWASGSWARFRDALEEAAPALLDAAEENEKYRTAANVLCAAHIGLPQASCPVCERDRLRQLIPVECCMGGDPNCHGPFGCLVRAQKAQTTDKQKLVDEAEAAKAERDMVKAALLALDGTAEAERDALRSEVERLREALNDMCFDIESLVGRPTAIEVEMATAPIKGGPWITKGAAIDVVRAALCPTKGEAKP